MFAQVPPSHGGTRAKPSSGFWGEPPRGKHLGGYGASRENNLEVNMKMIKSLILGSAAGLAALSGAQAADLPVQGKAVEDVRVCSLYGGVFFYIPGTDTCVKMGGYLRVDSTYGGGVYGAPFWSGDGGYESGQGNRFTDRINVRSRMALTLDTRTATEYGVGRTFVQ